ncbi:MAG: hypothetical protein ACTSWZ_05235 [Candidatus Heimdallarchaeaceae archaeon]
MPRKKKKRKYRFTKARRKALEKARRKWMSMTPAQRRRVMPSRTKAKKKYPIGTYMMLDVGRKGYHYQFVKKVKHGWKKVKAPRRLLKAGWVREGKGYVLRP